jgi:V/A-type H+-transporting ATPase subunit A
LDARNILVRGREAYEQINILGDDGVPVEYHEIFWKSEVIDFVILQQDAFDKIDASTPINRQQYMLEKVLNINKTLFSFEHFEEVNPYFKKIINVLKQMNYSEFESEQFKKFEKELEEILNEKAVVETEQP